MATIKEFVIPLLGLSNGLHIYNFDINHEFFQHFEMSKIQNSDLQLELSLDKRDSLVTLDFIGEGTYEAACDRCTQIIQIPINLEETLYIKYGESDSSDDEDVIWVDVRDSEIDLSTVVYELIHVHLPMLNLVDCESENYARCDKDALDKIDQANEEVGNTDESDLWQELKKIKFKK